MKFQVDQRYKTTSGNLTVKVSSNTDPGLFKLRSTIEAMDKNKGHLKGYRVGDVITHTIDGFWIGDRSPSELDLNSDPVD